MNSCKTDQKVSLYWLSSFCFLSSSDFRLEEEEYMLFSDQMWESSAKLVVLFKKETEIFGEPFKINDQVSGVKWSKIVLVLVMSFSLLVSLSFPFSFSNFDFDEELPSLLRLQL